MASYFRLVIDGALGSAERWSCGINFTSDGIEPAQGDLTDWVQDAWAFFVANGAPVQQLMAALSSQGEIQSLRGYWYNSVGSNADLVAEYVDEPIEGTGIVALPPQISRVYSLRTGIPGRRYRGRVYWPKVTAGLSTAFKDSAANESMATNFGVVLTALADATPQAGVKRPAVVSQAGGLVTPVTAITVGDVLDTQRRRRDGLVETYYTSSL